MLQKTQEGRGGLGGENPGAFPKVGPIFQQPFSLPESAKPLLEYHFVLSENRGGILQQRRNLSENFSSEKLRTATAFSSFLNDGRPEFSE